jgi:RNA polymerase sigma factor (sigma-70 family)
MKKKKSSPSFEESISIIDNEISKRRNKWNLSSLTWIDFDDVSQIIRIHIYKKWHLYNPKKPLAPWVNRIISNQIKNLIRNNYLNFIKPCAQCPEAEPDEGCKKFGKQCSNCPLYKEWEKNKKHAYNLNMPVSFESLENCVDTSYQDSIDIDKFKLDLDEKMKKFLKPLEWKLYEMLYIKKMTEKQAAKKMGYKSTEENRNPGYKQIKNMQKAIIKKIKVNIHNGGIDVY